jgi:hypothetical protein
MGMLLFPDNIGTETAGTPINVHIPLKIAFPVDLKPIGAGPGAAGVKRTS